MAPEVWFPNLGIEIGKLDSVAFQLFDIKIYWYGIIICAGIVSGILLLLREVKRTGRTPINTRIWCWRALWPAS